MAASATDVFETLLADYLDGTTAVPGTFYIGWGTSTTAPATTQTALIAAAAEARQAATMSQPTSATNRFVASITSAGTQTIAEAGVFDALTTGNMLARGTFTGVPVESGDTIQITIDIVYGAS